MMTVPEAVVTRRRKRPRHLLPHLPPLHLRHPRHPLVSLNLSPNLPRRRLGRPLRPPWQWWKMMMTTILLKLLPCMGGAVDTRPRPLSSLPGLRLTLRLVRAVLNTIDKKSA